jgi:hypothetical protein
MLKKKIEHVEQNALIIRIYSTKSYIPKHTYQIVRQERQERQEI